MQDYKFTKKPSIKDLILNETSFKDCVISTGDEYEKLREGFMKEMNLLPSKLNAVLLELRQLRQTNTFLTKENNELCSDIQDLISENKDLVCDNDRLLKCIDSQQQRIQSLKNELESCLQQAQDGHTSHEMKQIDAEIQLKLKLQTAAVERDQFRTAIQNLEQENKEMSKAIKYLINENSALKQNKKNRHHHHRQHASDNFLKNNDAENLKFRRRSSNFLNFLNKIKDESEKRNLAEKSTSFASFPNDVKFHKECDQRKSEDDSGICHFQLEDMKNTQSLSLTVNFKMDSDEAKILPSETQSAVGNDVVVELCETTDRISICSVRPEDPITTEQNLLVECDETIDTMDSFDACSSSTVASELLVDWDKTVNIDPFESCSYNNPALELLVEFGETADIDSFKYPSPHNPVEELLVEFAEVFDINS